MNTFYWTLALWNALRQHGFCGYRAYWGISPEAQRYMFVWVKCGHHEPQSYSSLFCYWNTKTPSCVLLPAFPSAMISPEFLPPWAPLFSVLPFRIPNGVYLDSLTFNSTQSQNGSIQRPISHNRGTIQPWERDSHFEQGPRVYRKKVIRTQLHCSYPQKYVICKVMLWVPYVKQLLLRWPWLS